MLRPVVVALLVAFAPHMATADAPESRKAEFLTEMEALAFLKGLKKDHKTIFEHDCKTYEDKNIDRLGRPFVMLSASFLKAFTEAHGPVTVTSAHRNDDEQKCVCAGTVLPCSGWRKDKRGNLYKTSGVSRHKSGLALDVKAGTGEREEYQCMHEFAKLNPIFGVHFPIGMRDPPHLEPNGRWGLRAYAAFRIKAAIKPPAVKRCTKLERMYERTWDD